MVVNSANLVYLRIIVRSIVQQLDFSYPAYRDAIHIFTGRIEAKAGEAVTGAFDTMSYGLIVVAVAAMIVMTRLILPGFTMTR